ncbi:MAG: hypothetical protein AB2813_08145 [Candidatus Sedimenticola endophacoides]
MGQFKPCQGKSACVEQDGHCLTCKRSMEELIWLRDLIEQLSSLSLEYSYENIDEYCDYVAYKLKKSIQHKRSL